jgi:hypothetical protein
MGQFLGDSSVFVFCVMSLAGRQVVTRLVVFESGLVEPVADNRSVASVL